MVRLFEIFFYVIAKYIFVETKMRGMKTAWRRLGEAARGTETVLQGLEGFLGIKKLRRIFHRAYGGPAPPPSS